MGIFAAGKILLTILYMCLAAAWAQETVHISQVSADTGGTTVPTEHTRERTALTGENRVLSLDGDGDYVEIADSESLNAINSQVTMEAWIKPTAFPNQWISIIHKEDERVPNWGNRSYALLLNNDAFIHLASAPGGQGQLLLNSPGGAIALNTWYHVAGIIDAKSGVMRVFINGAEVARRDFGNDIHVSALPLRIGWTHGAGLSSSSFEGQIDEVRIWRIARTQAEIQETMHTSLSGKEPGLVGYWRFDDVGNTTTDSSPSHSHGKLIGDAHLVQAELPHPDELVIPTVLSGMIIDEAAGKPVTNASVRLEQDGEEITQTQSDTSGSYRIVIFHPVHGQCDLSATAGDLGDRQSGIRLREGEHSVLAIEGGPDGVMWIGTDVGVSRYDGKEFVNFTPKDGLAHEQVGAVYGAPDGVMWFGTGTWSERGGLSRYDGKEFVNFTTEDGLVHNSVTAIYGDPDGVMWFGLWGDAITRYRRSTTPPRVHIASVRTTEQTYTDLSAIPAITIGSHMTIAYGSVDLKAVPEKRQYRYRISEVGARHASPLQWLKSMKAAQFEWTPKKAGTYIFEVQAIDRDLNYSEPASLELKILPPPVYKRAGFIIGTILAAFFIPTGVYTGLLIRQKKQAFEPIPNPYVVGNPIRSKEMFFGRESDFEFVRAKLAGGQAGLVIVFAGERRSGKTSILFQIFNGALGEQFVPVLLDMQAMAVDSDAEFLEKMASGISEALVGRTGGGQAQRPVPTPTDFREGNPIRAFERFMGEAMEALEDKALILMLDEYELIEAKIDDGVLRSDLITFFASLLEAHPRLSFIFTGSRHLEQRNPAYWHILIGKSLYRHISFLSQRDALRLITEPVADQVVYPRGIPERIVRLTAGQPFYTQVVCQNMMDRLNEVQRNRVRQEDVEAVAQELAGNPLPQMIYFWDGLGPEQQSALSLLGEVLENSDRYASAQMLVNFAKEQNLELVGALNLTPLPELERVLDDLFVHEVLERERAGEGQYEYRFRVDLFRLWVRQAHSVWQAT